MALTIKQDTDQENKINNDSTNVNKKILISTDKEGSDDDSGVKVHNIIRDKFANYVKNSNNMNSAYFKNTLTCVYSDIYKKGLVFKNIPDDSEVQANIIKIKDNVSYTKVYEILKYYSNEAGKEILNGKDLLDVTAMFFATLHSFIKRSFAE